MKKDFLGWRTVEPAKMPDGSINWFNLLLGGKRNLIGLLVLMFIIGLLYLGFTQLIGNYIEIAKEPCKFCQDYQDQTGNVFQNNLEIPNLDFDIMEGST